MNKKYLGLTAIFLFVATATIGILTSESETHAQNLLALNETVSTQSDSVVDEYLTEDLFIGMEGEQVSILQSWLVEGGYLSVGSYQSGVFDSATEVGVQRFQDDQGIIDFGKAVTTGYGRVGSITRASLNSIYSGNTFGFNWVQGKFGNAIILDGGHITVEDDPSLGMDSGVDFTLEAWVNPTKVLNRKSIVLSKGAYGVAWNYGLGIQEHGKIFMRHHEGDVVTSQAYVKAGEWTHIAVVSDDTKDYFYVNGELVESKRKGSYRNVPVAQPLRIGLSYNDVFDVHTEAFIGQIDDIRVYNTARTQPQIAEDAEGISIQGLDSPVVWFEFDEGQGTDVSDSAKEGRFGMSKVITKIKEIAQQALAPFKAVAEVISNALEPIFGGGDASSTNLAEQADQDTSTSTEIALEDTTTATSSTSTLDSLAESDTATSTATTTEDSTLIAEANTATNTFISGGGGGGSSSDEEEEENDEPLPEPTGAETTYSVSTAKGVYPKFLDATVKPQNVKVGDTQSLSVTVSSDVDISTVTATSVLDTQTLELDLDLVSVTPNGSIYKTTWQVFDTHTKKYNTTFHVTDVDGKTQELTLEWVDPCDGVTHGQNSTISDNCAVSTVDGLDEGQLTIAANKTLTLNEGAQLVFNPGKKYHNQWRHSNCKKPVQVQLSKRGYLFYPDSDGDGCPSSFTKEFSTDSTYSGRHRVYNIQAACDGVADGNDSDADCFRDWYADSDGDGYGATSATCIGADTTGYVEDNTDCYDSNANAKTWANNLLLFQSR